MARPSSLMRPPRPSPPASHGAPAATSAPSAPSTPATPVPAPAPHLLFGGPDLPSEFPPPGCVHHVSPEDARDKVLMAICAALARVENRALTPRQIVDVVHQIGIIKLGGNTPASTVSTHIRTHLARGTPPLLLRHSLQPRPRHLTETPSPEDRAVGPSPDGSAERKKGTSWYLSEAAGFASPWDRLGIPTPKEPESDSVDTPVPPSPVTAPAPTPPPMDPTRVSSRKRTRTKSWTAAARELGMDGMSPPDYEDESEAEAHRERKSKVRIRLRLGSRSASRSSSARPEDPQPQPEANESDPEPVSCSPVVTRRRSRPNLPPLRSRVFSAPSSQFTHFRRSLSYASSAGPPTPHAPTFADAEDSDVEDGDFHVRMMCNSDSVPSSPHKSTNDAPLVGIGVGLVFGEGGRRAKVKEEHESSMSPPSLSSRASSLAASSLPEDDVWAVKIEEPEDVTMTEVALGPEPCDTGLGFELGSSFEGFEAEFTLLSVHSPTIVPMPLLWEPEDVDGPESLCADEVDGLWIDLHDKRPHTRASRRESALGKANTPRPEPTPSKRRDSASWGCRAPSGMRVSLGGAKPRASTECPTRGVVIRREKGLQIERTILHGVEYGSCVVRGCVLLRRLEGSYVSLTALLRACRVPGSCHAQFRTAGTVDVAAPVPEASKADSTDNPSPPLTTPSTAQLFASTASTAPEPPSSDVIHTGTSSSEIHPSSMPLGASIDFGTGVEAADISGMWCPLADARAIAEERLRLYLPEAIRQTFLADVLPLKEPTPEVEDPKVEPEPEAETESKTEKRDETPMATAIPEKVLTASEDDVSVYVRPSSPAAVPVDATRILIQARIDYELTPYLSPFYETVHADERYML
ncbi:hypothetical protein FRC10_009783 [Ceratobasidium sp. 414]|nr:hypothetical protein FRC10_009783 [Ceratobasidium sp. 414]